jgi:hypothetical protein
VLGVLVVGIAMGWAGFRVPAASFEQVTETPPVSYAPPPQEPPEPVQRYINQVYGDQLPQVQSAIVQGRATVTINGLTMPTRFRFYYDASGAHYHDIQVNWFGRSVMFIHERFLDQHAILDIPIIGRVENDEATDAASNQGFWSEALAWVPAIVFNDPRVRWEGIDATHARMIVPNATPEEAFIIGFDPTTGLMSNLRTQRYQGKTGSPRLPWNNTILEWRNLNGIPTAVKSGTAWEDNPSWAVWEIEQVVLNVDVAQRMGHFGA